MMEAMEAAMESERAADSDEAAWQAAMEAAFAW